MIFKFSWRKIIPLPFIFKPIDCTGLNRLLRELLSELKDYTQELSSLLEVTNEQESQFANVLLTYCEALIQTISLLEEITHLLALKSKGSNKYNLKEHNEKCELYNSSVSRYVSIGGQMNDLYQRLYGSRKISMHFLPPLGCGDGNKEFSKKHRIESKTMKAKHENSKLPFTSAVALLYPLGAALYAWKSSGGNIAVALGYGLGNFGYLLFAAGIFAGSFRILGLNKRLHVFVVAIILFALGSLLCNLSYE